MCYFYSLLLQFRFGNTCYYKKTIARFRPSNTLATLFFSLLCYSASASADFFISDKIITSPDRHHFSMCHAQGCKEVEQLSLSDQEWQKIKSHFQPAAQSAQQERQQIAQAIAEFERIIGAKTGTDRDKARLFEHMGSPGQLDCIDESTNTTIYLTILKNHGLLRWHEPIDHVTRGFFIFGWPHSSAAMREINPPHREYAVDSWFEDNGKPPHIIPLKLWRDGWDPENNT